MILYHAITTYHILKFCVHKLRFHPMEKAILLVPDFLVRKPIGLSEPSLSGIFEKVYFFYLGKKKHRFKTGCSKIY